MDCGGAVGFLILRVGVAMGVPQPGGTEDVPLLEDTLLPSPSITRVGMTTRWKTSYCSDVSLRRWRWRCPTPRVSSSLDSAGVVISRVTA